jgi:hypothetical protein
MIDIQREELITLSEAAKFVPRRRRGRKVSTSTIYRWASKSGLRGVRLSTIRAGGALCTSVEALQRFFDELTASGDSSQTAGDDLDAETSLDQQLAKFGL